MWPYRPKLGEGEALTLGLAGFLPPDAAGLELAG
jgi:hypothetical protein